MHDPGFVKCEKIPLGWKVSDWKLLLGSWPRKNVREWIGSRVLKEEKDHALREKEPTSGREYLGEYKPDDRKDGVKAGAHKIEEDGNAPKIRLNASSEEEADRDLRPAWIRKVWYFCARSGNEIRDKFFGNKSGLNFSCNRL